MEDIPSPELHMRLKRILGDNYSHAIEIVSGDFMNGTDSTVALCTFLNRVLSEADAAEAFAYILIQMKRERRMLWFVKPSIPP